MAVNRIAIIGFEMASLALEPIPYGTSSASTAYGTAHVESGAGNVRTGTYSLKLAPGTNPPQYAAYWGAGGETGAGCYLRAYFKFAVLPTTSSKAILGHSTGSSTQLCVTIKPDGALEIRTGGEAGTVRGTSTTKLTDTSRWYMVEVKYIASAWEVKIDGVSEITYTGVTVGAIIGCIGTSGTVADTYTAYVDDISIDSGAWVGPGNNVMLLPTALSSAGNWTEGDGAGTAGMAAAVATRPPPGVDSASETSATNIESAYNGRTDCDMTMTTYSAAGIGASDTINAIQSLVRHGGDISTTSKDMSAEIVSNPAYTDGIGFTAGNNLGAHGNDPSSGFWITYLQVISNNPSVTKGTAPVLRVTKITATTRVVCCDFMGMYVDYTPRRSPPFAPRTQRNFGLRR